MCLTLATLPICLFLFRSGNQSSKRGGDCLYQGPHVAWGIKKPGERFCSPGTRSVMVKRPTRPLPNGMEERIIIGKEGVPFFVKANPVIGRGRHALFFWGALKGAP